MATIWERLTGKTTEEGPQNDSIAWPTVLAAMRDTRDPLGTLDVTGLQTAFNMTLNQQTQLVSLYSLITAAPNKEKMLQVIDTVLALGEEDIAYTTQSAFLTRLQTEVVDQGGTLP